MRDEKLFHCVLDASGSGQVVSVHSPETAYNGTGSVGGVATGAAAHNANEFAINGNGRSAAGEIARMPAALPVATRRRRDIEPYAYEADQNVSAMQSLSVLWRRRWIILGCILLGLAGGMVYQARTPPVFDASSTVYVTDSIRKMVDDPMSSGQRSASYLFTQCQIITSTEVLSLALQSPEVANAKMLRGVDNPVGLLKASISAAPDKLSELIIVTMESSNPQDAATIVNGVVNAYIDYQGKKHKSTAVQVLTILAGEVRKYESELEKNHAKMLALRHDNPDLTFATNNGNLVMTRLGDLSTKLANAQMEALNLKTAAAGSKAFENDPVQLKRLLDRLQITNATQTDNIDAEVMNAFRQERRRLDDLLYTYGPKHDSVIRTQRDIDQLEADVRDQTHRVAESYAAVLKQAQDINAAQLTELAAAMQAVRGTAIELNNKQAEYEQLAQEVVRIERSLDVVTSRMKDVNLNEDVGSLTISALEVAKPKFSPIRPLPSKTMGMAMVAGLMVGCGLAFLRDMMDTRLRSADDISAILDLPILGSVPHMNIKGGASERGQQVQLQPRSSVAEAYRTVRTAIYFGVGDHTAAKTILVTSPAPGDGKSTFASNLAIAAAQAGRRILLIDADCRRPSQHRIFKLGDGGGLATILMGKHTIAEAVRPSGIENLSILPCGALPPNPAELLDSQAMLDLLQSLSAHYDQIFVDSPPVVPVTDARILSALCDLTVIVLKADSTKRRMVEHTRDALTSVGANLLGVVVNNVPIGTNGYGYDYYGLGRYGYAPAKENGVAHRNGHSRLEHGVTHAAVDD